MAGKNPLTPLGLAALGLLAERPMHPYEMYQELVRRHEDDLVKVRPGTLYHAVARLAGQGLVQVVGVERDGNRPERTTYAILPSGRDAMEQRLRELLAIPINEYPSFPQALDEAHNLPADVVEPLLQQRRRLLQEQLPALAGSIAAMRDHGLAPRYWIDISYRQTMINTEIQWLDALCADLRSGELAWDTPTARTSQE